MDETVSFDLDEAQPKPRKDWSDYVRGVAVVLRDRRASAFRRRSPDRQRRPARRRAVIICGDRGGGRLCPSQQHRPLDRSHQACPRLPARRERVRRHALRHHGSVHRLPRPVGHALLIDCRSLERRLVPIDPKVRMVMCNTMVHHEHADGEYNLRRRDCEEGVRRLASVLPGIKALRDVTPEQLGAPRRPAWPHDLPPLPAHRHRERPHRARRRCASGRRSCPLRTAHERIACEHARRLRDKLP